MKRVLSGIRATGRLHIGNYLGAVKGMLELQDNPEYETLYMVADLHTITTPFDPKELKENRREVVLDYLAAGLDPEKCAIFYQSDVQEHAELAFYLSSMVTIARMQHLPTYKDKVKQYPNANTMALLNYPVLMAADILAYKANSVPVGVDQEPHLEVAREIARKMNQQYGTDFPEPKRFATEGEYVPSLTGEGKMAKSVEGSYIVLTDDLETVKKKIARIPTDEGKGDPASAPAGVKALFQYIQLFQGKEKRADVEKAYQNEGLKYQEVKNELAEALYNELKPIQEKREKLIHNSKFVDMVVQNGAQKARAIAQATVKEVKEKMGLA